MKYLLNYFLIQKIVHFIANSRYIKSKNYKIFKGTCNQSKSHKLLLQEILGTAQTLSRILLLPNDLHLSSLSSFSSTGHSSCPCVHFRPIQSRAHTAVQIRKGNFGVIFTHNAHVVPRVAQWLTRAIISTSDKPFFPAYIMFPFMPADAYRARCVRICI